MKFVVNARLIFFFSALVMIITFSSVNTFAHVDSDSMPDSVAETEYRIYLEFKPNDIVVMNKLGMFLFFAKIFEPISPSLITRLNFSLL